MTQEALKLALEALENSVDLVVEDAYNAEKLYGNYPTRQGKVGGLKVLADQHKAAITAIKEALAQPTSSDYALGYSIGFGEGHSAGKALAQPEQETVSTDWERIARVQNAKLMAMCNEAGGFEKLCEVMDKYEKTPPPQRTWVELTDEQIDAACKAGKIYRIDFIRAYQAAHGIKENT